MRKFIFLFISIFPLTGSAFSNGIGIESDSGIHGPAYSEQISELRNLETEFAGVGQYLEYGRSLEGRPLAMLRIGGRHVDESRFGGKAIYIGGTTHGDEYLNIEDRLPRVFLTEWARGQETRMPELQRFLANGGVIYIAPILNPDGYEHRQRENLNGIDLNRDFALPPENMPGFSQPETRSLVSFLDADLKKHRMNLRVGLDYHCCIGALLYPWSYDDSPEVPEEHEAQFQVLGKAMLAPFKDRRYRLGKTPHLLGYSAMGTSKDYYYAQYGTLAFTFEGVYRKENQNLDQHIAMWEAAFRFLNAERQAEQEWEWLHGVAN